MNFLDKLVDHIESSLTMYSPIRVGMLGTGNSIAIRPTPGSMPSGYLNGGRLRPFSFQVLTQHSDPQTAYYTLEEIADLLDATDASISGEGYVMVRCELYTAPNFVEVTDQGLHIYTALFEAELLKEVGRDGGRRFAGTVEAPFRD